ncbi:MAG: hypothetical protein KA314_04795 [Chloroflexi bacterium]|nr:hypothetical protein [Chloroflexota bacterium]
MSKSNWTKPLDEIVAMATGWFTERGYVLTEQSGRNLAAQFYMGQDREYAGRKIQVALEKSVAEVTYQKRIGRLRQLREMEEQLVAEGWVYCQDISVEGAGVWWYEPLNLSVNRMGGTFPTREAATVATFNSGLRKTINGEE